MNQTRSEEIRQERRESQRQMEEFESCYRVYRNEMEECVYSTHDRLQTLNYMHGELLEMEDTKISHLLEENQEIFQKLQESHSDIIEMAKNEFIKYRNEYEDRDDEFSRELSRLEWA